MPFFFTKIVRKSLSAIVHPAANEDSDHEMLQTAQEIAEEIVQTSIDSIVVEDVVVHETVDAVLETFILEAVEMAAAKSHCTNCAELKKKITRLQKKVSWLKHSKAKLQEQIVSTQHLQRIFFNKYRSSSCNNFVTIFCFKE